MLQLADLVFVGKSLPPRTEGQTPIEAAILGKAILFGPGMENFHQAAAGLVECGGARVIADAAALASACAELLRDDGRREEMAAAAKSWNRANLGATARTIAVLREELSRLPAAGIP
jgi:3-deoxy-D-manno-octulosonic-acid transferase